MKYSDHPLVTEAWRKTEEFGEEVRREGLLAQTRAAQGAARRQRLARLLVALARRLEPNPKPFPQTPCPDCR